MKEQATLGKNKGIVAAWSNPILIAAITGIRFLTLYPFRFSLHTPLPESASPFLLGRGVKQVGSWDAFLNVLLFVPLGFGLTLKLRTWGISRRSSLGLALLTGALPSYAIEFTQLYIPQRD
jgi:glycopeptide antibiotics resistance protein